VELAPDRREPSKSAATTGRVALVRRHSCSWLRFAWIESASERKYAPGSLRSAHWSWLPNSRSCICQNLCWWAAHIASSAAGSALGWIDSGMFTKIRRSFPVSM